jgi:hypothetical protein
MTTNSRFIRSLNLVYVFCRFGLGTQELMPHPVTGVKLAAGNHIVAQFQVASIRRRRDATCVVVSFVCAHSFSFVWFRFSVGRVESRRRRAARRIEDAHRRRRRQERQGIQSNLHRVARSGLLVCFNCAYLLSLRFRRYRYTLPIQPAYVASAAPSPPKSNSTIVR